MTATTARARRQWEGAGAGGRRRRRVRAERRVGRERSPGAGSGGCARVRRRARRAGAEQRLRGKARWAAWAPPGLTGCGSGAGGGGGGASPAACNRGLFSSPGSVMTGLPHEGSSASSAVSTAEAVNRLCGPTVLSRRSAGERRRHGDDLVVVRDVDDDPGRAAHDAGGGRDLGAPEPEVPRERRFEVLDLHELDDLREVGTEALRPRVGGDGRDSRRGRSPTRCSS